MRIELRLPNQKLFLPVFELDRAHTQKRFARVRPFDPARGFTKDPKCGVIAKLEFSAWQLFHAAKKAELVRTFSRHDLHRQSVAFAAEFDWLFAWGSKVRELRIVDGAPHAIKDSSRTHLAGRFAEGVAHIFMTQLQNYVFWDHLPSLWRRALYSLPYHHEEHLRRAAVSTGLLKRLLARKLWPKEEPDFAFENASYDVALVESKGGFVGAPDAPVLAGSDPDVKGDLRKALSQLAAWSPLIAPVPKKVFGVATYLREEGDSSSEPSLIAFVDPENEDANPLSSPWPRRDWIRRGNYGAWLIGMGLWDTGESVRRATPTAVRPIWLPVLNVYGRDYAVVPQLRGYDWALDDPSTLYGFGSEEPATAGAVRRWIRWLRRRRWSPSHPARVRVLSSIEQFRYGDPEKYPMDEDPFMGIGIAATTLRIVSDAARTGGEQLLDVQPIPAADLHDPQADDQPFEFQGSAAPDGTLVGMFRARSRFTEVRTEQFWL